MAARIRYDDVSVGDELPVRSNRVDRAQLVAYAGASGDFNPIHWNEEFARMVGLPGVIAHGMFTMALVARAVCDWAGDPGALQRISVQFRKEVRPDETVVARGRVAEKDDVARTVRLELWAELEREGTTVTPIRNGEAVVALA
ncbi:MAG: MaoC family dehydratase N-terminal domain-containing protein [Actinomycetota bacterium]|nr:MaoC family dehydratase N-terminal domain-containing protein [Actinomycetota bacterium]